MPFNTSQQVIDRYSMGNQASTLMSLLTLKEVIFAQNQLFYVCLRHHRLSLKFRFISLSFTPYARKFLIFQILVLFRMIIKMLKATTIQTSYGGKRLG